MRANLFRKNVRWNVVFVMPKDKDMRQTPALDPLGTTFVPLIHIPSLRGPQARGNSNSFSRCLGVWGN
jgi:hypothetical protein